MNEKNQILLSGFKLIDVLLPLKAKVQGRKRTLQLVYQSDAHIELETDTLENEEWAHVTEREKKRAKIEAKKKKLLDTKALF